ncbi:hypothetical protein M5K25_021000 [Dendrobium thyrsiflorum]|uniref:Uncharacterized protein n=1 Tax=Dendrobium thyrsiflorum TaxID=117978 RepID=A0ABD0UC55_DENTH
MTKELAPIGPHKEACPRTIGSHSHGNAEEIRSPHGEIKGSNDRLGRSLNGLGTTFGKECISKLYTSQPAWKPNQDKDEQKVAPVNGETCDFHRVTGKVNALEEHLKGKVGQLKSAFEDRMSLMEEKIYLINSAYTGQDSKVYVVSQSQVNKNSMTSPIENLVPLSSTLPIIFTNDMESLKGEEDEEKIEEPDMVQPLRQQYREI